MRYLPYGLVFLVLGAGCAPSVPAPEATTLNIEVAATGGEVTITPLADIANDASVEEGGDVIAEITANNFSFTPNTLRAKSGQNVQVTFREVGAHTFAIDELNVSHTIVDGGTLRFTAPSTPGNYRYYCAEGSHAALGMEGTLIVE